MRNDKARKINWKVHGTILSTYKVIQVFQAFKSLTLYVCSAQAVKHFWTENIIEELNFINRWFSYFIGIINLTSDFSEKRCQTSCFWPPLPIAYFYCHSFLLPCLLSFSAHFATYFFRFHFKFRVLSLWFLIPSKSRFHYFFLSSQHEKSVFPTGRGGWGCLFSNSWQS